MEGCLAGAAKAAVETMPVLGATGAVVAKETFDYNRENFFFDREMRQRKEFKLLGFKLAQASQWREDVRDLISLTESKMHVYLLVNVLMVGFAVVLWCEGRLPETTPDWLMMGSALSITGTFMFLLMSIWLALHAAISAQSYETRLLTQMVRLPVPTWQQVEACRACASDFENVDTAQVFRVPFLMGKQQSWVRGPDAGAPRGPTFPSINRADRPSDEVSNPATTPPTTPRLPQRGAVSRGSFTAPDDSDDTVDYEKRPHVQAADPWGLERRGDDIEELGCHTGSAVSKLRHVKIARQAMAHWQSYDAFARISMSVGMSQLCLAMSYYIIGYVCVEVGCRSAATYGVLLLTVLSETLMRLDMSLQVWQLRCMQILLALGPFMACLAAFDWSERTVSGFRLAEACVVVSFISHGVFLGVMTRLCRIKLQDNGTMLPVAFRSVLYLDVFGWLRTSVDGQRSRPMPRRSFWGDTQSLANVEHLDSKDFRGAERGRHNPLVDSRVMGHHFGDTVIDSNAIINYNQAAEATETRQEVVKPSHEAVRYERGVAMPQRPEDLGGKALPVDYRREPGAPQPDMASGSEFFDSQFWLPGEAGGEDEVDDADDEPAHTLHVGKPGELPWRVFCLMMSMLCFCWITAGVYHCLGAMEVYDLDPPIIFEDQTGGEISDVHFRRAPLSLNGFMVMPLQPNPVLQKLESINVSWPHDNVVPRSLSCDEDGARFTVTDGLMLFSGEILEDVKSRGELPTKRHTNIAARLSLRRSKASQIMSLDFGETPCVSLAGAAPDDTAVLCVGDKCEAAALTEAGRSVAICSLPYKDVDSATKSRNLTRISGKWLEQLRDSRTPEEIAQDEAEQAEGKHVRLEKASSLAFVPRCLTGDSTLAVLQGGCAMLGTSKGRVVKLRSRAGSEELVPLEALHQEHITQAVEASGGIIRAIGDRYFAVLEQQGEVIQVFDMFNGGSPAGKLRIPHTRPATAFCVGGGHVYMLGEGSSPEMWRAALPEALLPRST